MPEPVTIPAPQQLPATAAGFGFPPPPEGFGLVWRDAGIKSTRRGDRRLSRARMTDAFRDAMLACPGDLRALGYAEDSWRAPGQADATVLHWGDGTRVDPVAIADVERRTQEYMERRRVEAAERVARVKLRTAEVQAELSGVLADIGWAWSPPTALRVRDLLAADELVEWQWSEADVFIRRARDAVIATKAAIAAEAATAAAGDLARCADASYRASVLRGMRDISAFDDDMARVRNGVGWSRSTTCLGHVLSREDSLDPGQACVAMRLLRVHRRQLPDDLRRALGLA